ncbi:MAG: isocitrate/isopropylmalate family dehydrogenase, partial [Thermodesulfobacteriota bacterium]|nr:isocitrate/isopropylmalate family dehydrogenase [Thermodesulfobacteriota bacterium]
MAGWIRGSCIETREQVVQCLIFITRGTNVSNKYKIAVIPGDGTGPEVVAEGIKALEAISRKCGIDFQFKEFGLGG